MSLEKAIEWARKNPILPIGRNSISRFAAILTDGKQEFIGWNSYRTHPLQAKYGVNDESVHVHCEIDAIVKGTRELARRRGRSYGAITDLSDFSLYVARVLKDGTQALARPCEGCWRAITAFEIRKVEWTE